MCPCVQADVPAWFPAQDLACVSYHHADSAGLAFRPEGTQLLGLVARRLYQDPEEMEPERMPPEALSPEEKCSLPYMGSRGSWGHQANVSLPNTQRWVKRRAHCSTPRWRDPQGPRAHNYRRHSAYHRPPERHLGQDIHCPLETRALPHSLVSSCDQALGLALFSGLCLACVT